MAVYFGKKYPRRSGVHWTLGQAVQVDKGPTEEDKTWM